MTPVDKVWTFLDMSKAPREPSRNRRRETPDKSSSVLTFQIRESHPPFGHVQTSKPWPVERNRMNFRITADRQRRRKEKR